MTHKRTEKDRQLVDGSVGKKVGEKPKHTIVRKPGTL
jgi:hypothetical protein